MKTKTTLLQILIILLVSMLAYVLVFHLLETHYRAQVNAETAALLEAVHEQYPDVPEEELIASLRNASDSAGGEALLAKYGYESTSVYSSHVRSFMRQALMASLLMALFLVLLFSLLLGWATRRNRKRIEELIRYTKELSRGVYDLRIEENREDALSRLSNALYKVTIRMSEEAEHNRRRSEALSDSLADISHQLKTPLTSMRIMLDNIAEDPDMPEDVRADFLRSISEQIDWISSLVISLLQLARFDSGAVDLQPDRVRIGDVMQEVLDNLAILAEVKGVSLHVEGDADARLSLDRRWETEALQNIVKNCIEHSPAGATVKVTIVDSNLFLKLLIHDDGEGIARDDLRHIFERFYKTKNSTAESVGIGLSFAKTIIEKDNGYITVESEEGKGTTFQVRYMK